MIASAAEAVQQLKQTYGSNLITPEDARYEQARRVWNAMIDKRPVAIVRPRTVADVQAAIAVARAHHLTLAVRGGGHNVAGRATCDDGLVIDFSEMKAVTVDPSAKTAVAQPGARWDDFDAATQAHGLATTGGTVGDTGIAGLTLGGGFGWLEGKYGMTVDNLLAADVVLASGEFVRASEHENPDLFWALRGGGGNFGVVTAFTYRLHEVSTVIGGMVVHPYPRAAETLRFYNEFMKTAPDELVAAAVLMTGPDGNKACGIVVCYVGDLAQGERVLAPLKQFGPPVMNTIGPISYLAQQGQLGTSMPPNMLNYWKAEFVREISEPVIQLTVDAHSRVPSPNSSILFFPIRGAASRVAPTATAFPHRGGYHVGFYSMWHDLAQKTQNIEWVRELWRGIQPHMMGGVYVNELGEDEGADRVASAYGANYERLAAVKAKYDPHNLFCLNANIVPAAAR